MKRNDFCDYFIEMAFDQDGKNDVPYLQDADTQAPRNPSPPPDVESLLPDKIGATTFSKRGVLSTLMHIASLVHERSISRQSGESSNGSSQRSLEGSRRGTELVTEARTPNQGRSGFVSL